MVTIIEDGEQLDITEELAARLVKEGIIFPCPDCAEGVFYHLMDEKTWEDIPSSKV